MKKQPYSEYLKSPHWDNLRREVLARANYRCEECGDRNVPLQAHHKFYRQRWEDSIPTDMLAVCVPCHREMHKMKQDAQGNWHVGRYMPTLPGVKNYYTEHHYPTGRPLAVRRIGKHQKKKHRKMSPKEKRQYARFMDCYPTRTESVY